MLDSSTGYATDGDDILKTSNGGAAWGTVGYMPGPWNAAISAGPGTVVCVGEEAIKCSHDDGVTWLQRIRGIFGYVYSLRFTDVATGWAVTDSGLYRTGDSGATWGRVRNASQGAVEASGPPSGSAPTTAFTRAPTGEPAGRRLIPGLARGLGFHGRLPRLDGRERWQQLRGHRQNRRWADLEGRASGTGCRHPAWGLFRR